MTKIYRIWFGSPTTKDGQANHSKILLEDGACEPDGKSRSFSTYLPDMTLFLSAAPYETVQQITKEKAVAYQHQFDALMKEVLPKFTNYYSYVDGENFRGERIDLFTKPMRQIENGFEFDVYETVNQTIRCRDCWYSEWQSIEPRTETYYCFTVKFTIEEIPSLAVPTDGFVEDRVEDKYDIRYALARYAICPAI